MPKIIKGIKQQLLEQTRREMADRGYARTTVRSVAEGCSISAGTVYNYFRSKDELVAATVAEDWERATEKLGNCPPSSVSEAVSLLWKTLRTFREEHRAIFADPEAGKKFSSVFARWHPVLREQLASFLSPFLGNGFLSLFVSEAVLSWVREDVEEKEFLGVIEKLTYKEKQ